MIYDRGSLNLLRINKTFHDHQINKTSLLAHLGNYGMDVPGEIGACRRHIQTQLAAQVGQAGPVQVAAGPLNPANGRRLGRGRGHLAGLGRGRLAGLGSLGICRRYHRMSVCLFHHFRDEPGELGQLFFRKSNIGKEY